VKLQENCNDNLKRKLSEVATALEDDYEVEFDLITTGSLTNSAFQDYATFQEQIAKSDDFTATIHLVDNEELKRRYNLALDKENPSISHSIQLDSNKYLQLDIAGTRAILAALPIKDCLNLPGIKDSTLFQKNVRQSLGLSNPVNKEGCN